MKKTAAIALSLLLVLLSLAGCGTDKNTKPSPTPTVSLEPTADLIPDVSDGMVDDDDGILEPETPKPEETADMEPGESDTPENGARAGARAGARR